MPKAIATIADVNTYDTSNPGKFTLTIAACGITSASVNFKKEVYVVLDGTENPQQINTAIANAIIAYAATVGMTLTTSDISSPKFS
jgi:hypothetical protein